MESNHLLIITNLPAFYKKNLYKEVSKHRKVTIIFNGLESGERKNDFFEDFEGIDVHYIKKDNFIFRLLFLCKMLYRLKFDELLIGGWDSIDLWLASLISKRNKNSMILESSFNESYTKGYKYLLKKIFLNRISKVYASGSSQVKLLDKLNFQGKIIITKGVGLINRNRSDKKDAKKDDKFNFLYLGRYSEEKNIEFIINFFNDNTNLSLTLIGYGYLEEKINDLIKASTNIKNIGSVKNKLLYKYFQNHDIFILPSKREPWGLVVEEALYNGLPVIVSNMVGCADEIVYNGVNGYIFDINSSESFKEKIDLITNLKTFNILLNNVQSTDFNADFNHQINAYL